MAEIYQLDHLFLYNSLESMQKIINWFSLSKHFQEYFD
jgi:hypothetical protein